MRRDQFHSEIKDGTIAVPSLVGFLEENPGLLQEVSLDELESVLLRVENDHSLAHRIEQQITQKKNQIAQEELFKGRPE